MSRGFVKFWDEIYLNQWYYLDEVYVNVVVFSSWVFNLRMVLSGSFVTREIISTESPSASIAVATST